MNLTKIFDVIQAIGAALGAIAVVCSLFANFLPDGKAKTAFSFAGLRLVKAVQIIRGAIPTTPSGVPIEPKKAPSAPTLPLFCLVTLLAFAAIGCAGSFEEARLVSHPKAPPTTVDERAHCYAVDNSRIVWGGAAKVLGAAAGATGLASLPIKDGTPRDVVLGGAVVAGVAAAGAVYLAEQRGEEWARDCQ